MVDINGYMTNVAGNGQRGYSGDGGLATSASLNYPYGVFADHTGKIYIADTFNNVIRIVDTSGIISTVAGTGKGGYSGDRGSALQVMPIMSIFSILIFLYSFLSYICFVNAEIDSVTYCHVVIL
jgi:hypothetical protein